MLRIECDRCKELSPKKAEAPIELFGIERVAEAQAGPPFGDYKLPGGWRKILGKDICPDCVHEFEHLINTYPASASR